MSLTTRVGLLAGASALTLTGASFADNSTEAQDLAAQVAQLKAEVAQLKGDNWLTEQRAEEIRGLVQDVLADADTRSSLLQAGMTAGYDDGFVIGSPDGNFSLKMNGQLQWRFVYNYQDFDDYDEDTNRWGFENTRTKLMFSGNVGGPQWKYFIEGNFFRDGGDFDLDNAWIAYETDAGWTIKAGQFKLPALREWNVHSMNQLLVERSSVSYLSAAASHTQGIAFVSKGEQFSWTGSINDGISKNTAWSTYDTEFAFSGRFQWLASGTWEQFEDMTSPQGSEQGMLFGIGGFYQKDEYGAGDDDKVETQMLTADASLEFDGWNLFGSFTYDKRDDDNLIDTERMGIVVQGGFYFTETLEGFLRYEFYDFDEDNREDLSIITGGINAYYSSNVKMTADVGYGLDQVTIENDITGWRSDPQDEDGQFVFRTQLQLVF